MFSAIMKLNFPFMAGSCSDVLQAVAWYPRVQHWPQQCPWVIFGVFMTSFCSPIIWWSISDSQEWTNCPSDKKIDKMQHSIKFPSLNGNQCHKDLDLIPAHKTLNYWRCGQLKTVIALNIFNHTSLLEVIKKAIHSCVPLQAILVVSTGVHLM